MKKLIITILLTMLSITAYADVYIDMQKIRMMESSGNPKKYNTTSKAKGLYQITPIALLEWNNFHPSNKYTSDQLFVSTIHSEIAHWYMNHRIPQMLRAYKREDTVANRLISYNAGIDYVVRKLPLPDETKEYRRRYNK